MKVIKPLDVEEVLTEADDEGIPALPPRQERALHALLTTSTQKEAALAAGVSETTLWRYMDDPAFQRCLREVQRHTFTYGVIGIQRDMDEAVSVIREIMTSVAAPHAARLSAAKSFIDYSARFLEIGDLKKRMDELEDLFRARQEEEVIAATSEEEGANHG
jgi:hypothetical protein